ncbi:MAG: SRPBCC domain-containing protein [Nitrospinota bacterium]
MTDSFELTREIFINAQPETVFSFLTEESKMKEWYGEIVESDPKPGGVFRVAKKDGTADCRGHYVEIIPNKKVVFNWGGIEGLEPDESTVEILLEAKESGGTQLKLRHYNVRLKSAADSFGQGWKEHALPLLKIVSEGGTPEGLCFESGHECGQETS